MTALRAAFEAAGCRNVRSYIQSGNVLFDAPGDLALQEVTHLVSEQIGAPASILYRTLGDLDAIAESEPFDAYLADRTLKLYVVFLATRPSREPPLPAFDEKERLELIAVEGQQAYLVSRRKPSGVYGFPTFFVERELGVSVTARNWNTVTRLLAFARRDMPAESSPGLQ